MNNNPHERTVNRDSLMSLAKLLSYEGRARRENPGDPAGKNPPTLAYIHSLIFDKPGNSPPLNSRVRRES